MANAQSLVYLFSDLLLFVLVTLNFIFGAALSPGFQNCPSRGYLCLLLRLVSDIVILYHVLNKFQLGVFKINGQCQFRPPHSVCVEL